MAGVEAGQWGGLDLLGVLGVRLRALARVQILATSIFIQISLPKLLQID